MLLYLLAPNLLWFVVASVIWGIAASMGGTAPVAFSVDSAPPGMNAAAVSGVRLGGDLGYVVGPLTLGLLADSAGPAMALIATASLSFLAGLVFLKYAPETYRSRGAGA